MQCIAASIIILFWVLFLALSLELIPSVPVDGLDWTSVEVKVPVWVKAVLGSAPEMFYGRRIHDARYKHGMALHQALDSHDR